MPNTTYGRSTGRSHFGRTRHSRYVTKGYLKSIIGTPESKFYDFSPSPGAPITNAGTILGLNDGITQGVGSSSRVGNEVSNKTLHIRLSLQRAAVDSFVRVIIFWFIDAVVAPTVTTILQTANYQSPLAKNNGHSFWVKFDKTYTLAAGQTQQQVDEIYRSLRCNTEYPEASPIPNANSLHILFISDQATLANQPLRSFYSRLTYIDT